MATNEIIALLSLVIQSQFTLVDQDTPITFEDVWDDEYEVCTIVATHPEIAGDVLGEGECLESALTDAIDCCWVG
ncbi:MAG: hypothetical protein HRU00_09655 [Myxococcales bacterium]|nr:hypothetical protein [Myxococcales bacterium]